MFQCPAPRRALSFGVLVVLTLSACGYIPRPVEGVPPGLPWEALPLRKWLAEDRAKPVALAFCAPPQCLPGLVVSVVELEGRDAEIADSILADPEKLARALASAPGSGKTPRTLASAESIREGDMRGFAIGIAAAGSDRPPAYGAALGRRQGDRLRLVIVIGDRADAVRATVRDVALREL